MAGHIPDSKSICWLTPLRIKEPVHAFLEGPPTLDPCSSPWSIMEAQDNYLLPQNDGLKDPWDYPSVFVNPPFGNCWRHRDGYYIFSKDEFKALNRLDKKGCERVGIYQWVERCAETWKSHPDVVEHVVALVPAYVDTKVWQDVVYPTAQAVCYIRGRLKFMLPPIACAVDGCQNKATLTGEITDTIAGCQVPICTCLEHCKHIELPKGSLPQEGPAPMATALVYWGSNPERFDRVFQADFGVGHVDLLNVY